MLPITHRPHQHFLAHPTTQGETTTDKSRPYRSNNRVDSFLNNNGKYNCLDAKTKKIVCRYFSAYWVKALRSNELDQKAHVDEVFSTEQQITDNIKSNIDECYEELKNKASEKHLIPNCQFGHYRGEWFRTMRCGEQKVFLLDSSNHAMAFRLRIKGTEAEPTYVVQFFEPNYTNVEVRCEVKDIHVLDCDQHALIAFIGEEVYTLSFGATGSVNEEKECMIYDCTNLSETKNTKFSTLHAEHGSLTPIMLYHILCAGGVAEIPYSELERLPKQELLKQLKAKSSEGKPGLYVSAVLDKFDGIRMYGELLKKLAQKGLLSNKELTDLLQAKMSDGTPSLHKGLLKNSVQWIEKYGELLKSFFEENLLLKEDLKELLHAKNANEIPAFNIVFYEHYNELIILYGNLLESFGKKNLLLPKDIKELLEGRNADGNPTFYIALKNGSTQQIDVYAKLLASFVQKNLVANEDRMELLQAKDTDGNPALNIAFEDKDIEWVETHLEKLEGLAKEGLLTKKELKELLEAKDGNGTSCLYFAFKNGFTKGVDIYLDYLERLAEKGLFGKEDLKELLEAKAKNGTPVLYLAFESGFTKGVDIYQIGKEDVKELLEAGRT